MASSFEGMHARAELVLLRIEDFSNDCFLCATRDGASSMQGKQKSTYQPVFSYALTLLSS